jgi:hypothetical protein
MCGSHIGSDDRINILGLDAVFVGIYIDRQGVYCEVGTIFSCITEIKDRLKCDKCSAFLLPPLQNGLPPPPPPTAP